MLKLRPENKGANRMIVNSVITAAAAACSVLADRKNKAFAATLSCIARDVIKVRSRFKFNGRSARLSEQEADGLYYVILLLICHLRI